MRRIRLTLLSLSLFIATSTYITASTITTLPDKVKKETKKSLIFQRDSLQKVIDSMKLVLEGGGIAFADTTDLTDSINSGTFYYLDNEDYNDIDPGCNSDSLLNMWYNHRSTKLGESLGITRELNVDIDSLVLTSNIPDAVYIENLKKMNSFIPIPYNDIVRKYIILYTEKLRNKMPRILGLSNYYLPIFEEIFDQYGIPKEIKALAIIESALNPVAVSTANARGIWQFMYRTALQYNLKINSFVDERLDPVEATHAAAKYLRDAYIIFGDWALAISSYNCGSGNVNKAIKRAGGSKEFWDVYPYLPRETRGYVPAFVGALYALNYYKDYNIVPQQCPIPSHLDTFQIKKNLHFQQIAECISIPVDELRYYNPQYTKDIIPGNEGTQILKLPYQYTNAFVDVEDTVYNYKDSIFFNPIVFKKIKDSHIASTIGSTSYHKVKNGETLSKIAQIHRVKLSDLMKWNKLNSRSTLRIGQRIIIKKGATYVASNTGRNNKNSGSGKVSTSSSGGYIYYTVKKGDTLLGISHKFPGVSLNDLLKLNNLKKNSKIYPGKKLKIKRA